MKRSNQTVWLLAVAFCMGLFCGLACDGQPKKAPALWKAPEGWVVAYTNDFSGEKALENWVVAGGEAKIVDGALVVESTSLGDTQITLVQPKFERSVRLEFDGFLTGETICDLSPFINADDTGYQGGYLLQFGGGGNTESRLRRATAMIDGTVSPEAIMEPGKTYHVVAENDNGTVRLIVDGKEIFRHEDPMPLKGSAQGLVGFYTYDATLHVDNVVIYTKKVEAAKK